MRREEARISLAIPERFRNCTFESYVPKNKKQREALDAIKTEKSGNYLIYGSYGSGKTHLLYAQYRYLRLIYGAGCFVRSTHDLIRELQDEELHEKESPVNWELKKENPIFHLFWDDADKMKVSDYRQEILFDLIDRIYKHNQELTLTSNLTLAELQEKLSPAICRRIDDMCKVVSL